MKSEPGWQRNCQDAANIPDSSAFQCAMAWDRHLGEVARVHPDIMTAAVMMKETPLGAQVSFEGAAVQVKSLTIGFSHG
jgi:hypothetical protein